MATMVTPLPPVSVVKNALATMQTMARPPGIHPKTARAARDDAVGRLRLGHDVADEGEERDRDEDGRVGEALSSSTVGAMQRRWWYVASGWKSQASSLAPPMMAKSGVPRSASATTAAAMKPPPIDDRTMRRRPTARPAPSADLRGATAVSPASALTR